MYIEKKTKQDVCLNSCFTFKSTAKVMLGRCLHFWDFFPKCECHYIQQVFGLKYNHPTKPQKAYTHGWIDNHVSWAGSGQSGQ